MLTKNQESKIIEMRYQGWGYQAIATYLRISKDEVRNYCRKAGLIGQKGNFELKSEISPKYKECIYCGKLFYFKSKGRPQKFCCEACRRTWWSEHPELKKKNVSHKYQITCPICDRIFSIYGRPKQKYCSRSCAMKGRNIEHSKDSS